MKMINNFEKDAQEQIGIVIAYLLEIGVLDEYSTTLERNYPSIQSLDRNNYPRYFDVVKTTITGAYDFNYEYSNQNRSITFTLTKNGKK